MASPPRHAASSHAQRQALAHQEYLDSLTVPKLAQVEQIAEVQEKREAEVAARYSGEQSRPSDDAAQQREEAERAEAAGKIQRVFRGHRARRAMDGLCLDPMTRWDEVLKDARYRHLTTPRARTSLDAADGDGEKPDDARQRWNKVGQITRHAHGPSQDSSSSSSEDEDPTPMSKAARDYHKRQEKNEKRAWKGKAMDLPYFLEMVDLKHRYGSNLRAYHEEWKKADTHENFFYWLDHGSGKRVEVATCSRERLDREQVRYLSREERMHYLVNVDPNGKFRWAKNGELIDTTEEYRDSVQGIVPLASPHKKFRQDELEAMRDRGAAQKHDSSSDSSSVSESEKRYPEPDNFKNAKGPKKVLNVSPAVILNHLMRKSVKKNTWIFVADTSMNMYVGIKQSGSFQHSSFIQGSRISAAGLLKVKNGQLRSLAPLSGHYRPPTAAFKNFIEHLKAENVDMSRVSISKSYAVLVGLEAYINSKKRAKSAVTRVEHGVQNLVQPSKAKERKEQSKDNSQSAQIEAAVIRQEKEARPLGQALKVAREKIGADAGTTDSGSPVASSQTSLPDRSKVGVA